KNSKKLFANKIINRKSKTGYKSEITCYACEECRDCQYKSSCIKRSNSKIPLENRTKNLQVSKLFHEKRKENLMRIISPEGCELRMNRSIQAEGAFAQVKQNMKFRRFLSRGKENVLSECIIVAIAHNISRLHNKIVKNKRGIYLHHLKKVF
ncbi:transposase, partial [Clostridioides sp. ZZV15-6383]|uniref:transposase n=2 Tax=Clostridioides sp. ZZV15-6383 TaxID=2811498 RepID=UPI001D0F5B2B|nr:transposase [Clostridioides sp. ZZV15-6383]